MSLALAILGIVGAVIPFVVMLIKKYVETKDEDQAALNQLGASEFHAGVTGGVQPPSPTVQPK